MDRIEMIKPGIFSPLPAAADMRRLEFDIKNECLLVNETSIDFLFIGDSITQLWELDATLMASRELWKPEVIVKHVTEEIEQIAQQCKERGQSLIMCSILPTNRPLSPANEIRNEIIIEMNEIIRKIADSHGFIYVDYHKHFVEPDGKMIRDGLADDGVHPHIGGYEVMARVLSDTLQKANIMLALRNV